jgi:hypothetical protein
VESYVRSMGKLGCKGFILRGVKVLVQPCCCSSPQMQLTGH